MMPYMIAFPGHMANFLRQIVRQIVRQTFRIVVIFLRGHAAIDETNHTYFYHQVLNHLSRIW